MYSCDEMSLHSFECYFGFYLSATVHHSSTYIILYVSTCPLIKTYTYSLQCAAFQANKNKYDKREYFFFKTPL